MKFARSQPRILIALLMAIVSIVAASTTAAIAQLDEEGDAQFHEREMTAGAKTFKRVQTSASPRSTQSTLFTNLTALAVPVGPGRTALINVKWAGETSCSGGGAESNWCAMRVLVGGVEAHPQAGADFAIDSTAGGTAKANDWAGHLIERHRCVRNGGTSTVNFPVVIQWMVTNPGGGTAPVFRVDDWAFDVQRADNCAPLN